MVRVSTLGIRYESADLSIAKDGAVSFYVDRESPAASDENDGYSWSSPLQTITEALHRALPWTKIWVRGGEYYENLVVDKDNVRIIGAAFDGDGRVVIRPLNNSSPVVRITANNCELYSVAIETDNNDGVVIESAPNNALRYVNIKMDSIGAVSKYGIYLNDADSCSVENCWVVGTDNKDKLVGVMVDNGSVNCRIANCVIDNIGDESGLTGYGIAINNSQRILVEENTITRCNTGVYIYASSGFHYGCAVLHNVFGENTLYDVYDPNDYTVSGNIIDSNHYAYTGWFEDRDGDGIADVIVDCYGNYDRHPLSSPWSWKIVHTARRPR